ncbi:hypothetical protein [Capnocytophaga catalasegens]|uniref:DUF3850 domain-containing protein n=1 Tax=Capnocytophaga catalasegens TaxID=1004260 RepID=A0AAV5AWJ9_9FLAO|nr:hypothetical protein [Capnocytophaga catalasegens]GIZ15525.1 hypothetical protein RCZ03_15250 [Capnocytophaga catalasegens]GJM49868.1 hypothetical protein RCZ15_08430 [Capnocytophaga catalasegens]GJM54040.1 hypothetical protein RCZ16_23560 [Capnocytophaga catalasegens]
MKAIDLRYKYQHKKAEIIQNIRTYHSFTESHEKYKIGDVIDFFGGYYGHILYKSEILGFNKDGGIYVLWGCYWFCIKDNEVRKIKK